MDIDFDGIRGDITGQTENVVFDQLLRNNAILAAHQEYEHGRLARREDLRLLIDKRLPTFRIECEVRNLQRASQQLPGTTSKRFQTRQQVFERKWLDEM